jgi:hypothetical protein
MSLYGKSPTRKRKTTAKKMTMIATMTRVTPSERTLV